MRTGLYPLMAILWLGSIPFTFLAPQSDLTVIISGLLIMSLIGVAYLSLPIAALTKYGLKRKSIPKRMQGILMANLGLSLAGIGVAEIATLGPLMVIATVNTALSTLLLSALITSGTLLHLVNR
jgi:hypothetical protein